MTIRDMIDAGIEFQGEVNVSNWSTTLGDGPRWCLLSRLPHDSPLIHELEVRYIYPSNGEIVIEVFDKD